MDSPAEEIKKRIDLVDFIGGFITLKKSGRNYKAVCPFHAEKTPSFVVSPDRQIWHCFGACAEGGDVIKFLMKWENITFFEALKELAEKTGVKLKNVDFEDQAWKGKEKIFTINSLASEFYHYLLKNHRVGEKALDYLKIRQINQKLIETFQLGYSPSSWDSLLKFLKKKGYSYEEAAEAGLVIKSDRGSFYDRFRKRLIFPLKDSRGNILGFSGRILEGEGEAKYVNSPETNVYHKRETLFGLDLAKEAIKKKDKAILVEGEFDMISLFREGITNTVAIKGSAVTTDQLMILKRFTKRLLLCLDADSAGEDTTKRAITEAENMDFEISVITFDFAKDPDEAVNKDPEKFKKIVEKPTPIYDFLIDLSLRKNKQADAFSKKNVGDEVIPFIAKIKNPIVQSYYIKKLARVLDVETSAIEYLKKRELSKKSLSKGFKKIREEQKIDRAEMLQKYLLSLIFQNTNPFQILDNIFETVDISDFSIPSYQKLIQNLTEFRNKKMTESKEEFNLGRFTQQLSKELIPVFDEVFLFDMSIIGDNFVVKELNKTVFEFKRLSLKKRIMEKAGDAEKGNTVELRGLMDSLSQIEKKLILV